MDLPRLVVAGNCSGAGKTTVALGLMAALRVRGYRVQPFKCGPDYIDPAFHALAGGRACRSIDSWLLSRHAMVELVARASAHVDIAIIEGIMGLHDGRSGLGAEGSTAEIAKWLRAPVLLVLDVGRTAQSAGAMAMGYQEFDREVQIAGVVLNNVTSPTHLARATEAVETGAGLPVFGHIAYNPALTIAETHPRLMSPADRDALPGLIERTRAEIESTIDIEALLTAAQSAWPLPARVEVGLFPLSPINRRVRIAVIEGEVFDMYMPDNLDLLAAWGADAIPVDPLRDEALPEGVQGVYVGAGFPEVRAADLAANTALLGSLRRAIGAGLPVYGEGGGLAYLSEGIVDAGGVRHSLVGGVPGWAEWGSQGVYLGYALALTHRDTVLARKGRRIRGYEMFWSRLSSTPSAAYHIIDPDDHLEGYANDNLLASRLRLHFGSDASLAKNLVEACTRSEPAKAL